MHSPQTGVITPAVVQDDKITLENLRLGNTNENVFILLQ